MKPGNDRGLLVVLVEDSDTKPVAGAEVRLSRKDGDLLGTGRTDAAGRFHVSGVPAGEVQVDVIAKGTAERSTVTVARRGQTVVVTIGEPGTLHYWADRTKVYFRPDQNAILLAVRGDDAAAVSEQRLAALGLASTRLPSVRSSPTRREEPGRATARDSAFLRVQLPANVALDAAGRLIQAAVEALTERGLTVIPALVASRGDREIVGITREVVARFQDNATRARVDEIARERGMVVTRQLVYAGNAYVFALAGALTYRILDEVDRLRSSPWVRYAESNLLMPLEIDQYLPNDTLWANLTHLPLINCDDAWDFLDNISVPLRGGSADVTIAVFDPDGVTPNHPEFTANLTDGTSKLVTSWNFNAMAAQTVAQLGGDHGSQCAGVATAAFDNATGVAGIAPNCHLIGARIPTPATGVEMADAFTWAAGFDPGSTNPNFPALPARAADVISNSWGVTNAALSAALRDCFDFLTERGRNGRGCVVTFSTGNLGYVQFSNQRRFAAYDRNIAVGASINVNPTNPVNSCQVDPNGNTNNLAAVVDRRAFYSPFGPEMDIVAPSHTCYQLAAGGFCGGIIDPTTTTVRVGTGGLNGCTAPAVCNDYATSFGGTSHASPTIAGTAALVLSANPDLCWADVRRVMQLSAVQIDAANADPIGQWTDSDGDGAVDFSQWYGAGRVDVDAAVRAARAEGTPCYAPVFESAGCLPCLVLQIIYAFVILGLVIAALFSKKARCTIRQVTFRMQNCGRGNADNCIRA